MPERVGVIDIGSVSACLQLGDDGPQTQACKYPTRLGHEIRSNGALSKRGVRRVVKAARATVGAARELGVRELFCFATASVRDAANRDDVISAIEQDVGLRPQFLTGPQEGRLTYDAARRWAAGRRSGDPGRMLLLDVGGGTSEVVFGADDVPESVLSLPLGAGALTRTFLRKDPPSAKDLRNLERHVARSLAALPHDFRPERAVAASRILQQLGRLSGRGGPSARLLTAADLDRWIPRLADMPAARRAQLRGISTARAPYVLAGAVVARGMMRALDVSEVELCPWSLREGILLRHRRGRSLPLRPLRLR